MECSKLLAMRNIYLKQGKVRMMTVDVSSVKMWSCAALRNKTDFEKKMFISNLLLR